MPAPTAAPGRKPLRRPGLPAGVSFWAVAGIAFLALASNTAASPLYRLYQARFGFSATTLTLLFTVYVVVLLGTLLVLGSASDYVGRRAVILGGLAAGAVASGLFLAAHALWVLFAARAAQGVAVGLITGAASAALLDLRPGGRAAPLVSSVAPTAGQALGALGGSALAQYAPAPTSLVWWLLGGGFVAGIAAVLAMREPGTPRPGVLASLRPQVSVPREARSAFAAAVPCLVAVWALGGFYLALGPSLAAELTGSASLLWGGTLIFLLTGLGAVPATLLAGTDPRRVMLGGCLALTAGAVVTAVSVQTGSAAVLFAGTAIAGLGFGSAFTGAYRAAVALAPPGGRGGLITAIYIVSYAASSVPVVIGGIAASHYGLHNTALVYSIAVAALAAVAAGLLIRQMGGGRAVQPAGHAQAPPGPGTVPPCAPIAPRPAAGVAAGGRP